MAKNTIKLKKYLDIINEREAAGTITPGHLVELTSAGKVQAHSTAGGNAVKDVALEDELQGKGITETYTTGNQVQVWSAVPGEEAYMILKDGETVVIGDFLESAGDGTLQKHTSDVESFESNEAGSLTVYPLQVVAQALEAVDLSNSAVATSRIKVRFV